MSQSLWIIAAFAIYLLMMLGVGAFFFNSSKNTSDFFLGGRRLGGWVAALSAQASDMSGWLLMGLPGAIYAIGTGEAWIGVGLAIGTILNWILVTRRLRRYSLVAGGAVTLPEFFQNRFHDKSKSLRVISSIVLLIFFTVYIASSFSAGAKLFSTVFGIDYLTALIIGALVIVCYTFLGGFLAVCWTDFIQGMLMLAAILAVPVIILTVMPDFAGSLAAETAAMPNFLNPVKNTNAIGIISNLGWGLGYFGMPHIIVRFMAIRNDAEVRKSRVVGIVWVVLSLAAAVLTGVVGRAYLGNVLTGSDTEKVFINMILKLFTEYWYLPFLAGILLCGILAAVMSTADSQLLVASSSLSDDLVSSFSKKPLKDKTMLTLSRITVLVLAIIAFFIAIDPDSSIMGLVSNAWAGFGAAFGPMVLLALFWKRINTPGAFAGIFVGAATVILWDYIPLIGGQTLGAYTGLYSLVVGFALSFIAIVLISIITKKPSDEIVAEFELAAGKEDLDAMFAVEESASVEDAAEEVASAEEAAEEVAPAEEAVEEAAPVEEAAEEVAPVEETVEEAAPVEEAVEEVAPAEEAAEEVAPVEEAAEDASPVEESVEDTSPVEDTAE